MAVIHKNVFDITDNVFDIEVNIFDIVEDIGGTGIQFLSLNNLTILDFERGREVAIREPFESRQIKGFTNTNEAKIQDCGSDIRYFEIIITKLDESSYSAILAFFALDYVDYGKTPFTFIKEDHTTFETVRLWQSDGLNIPRVQGGLYNMNLLLRRDV